METISYRCELTRYFFFFIFKQQNDINVKISTLPAWIEKQLRLIRIGFFSRTSSPDDKSLDLALLPSRAAWHYETTFSVISPHKLCAFNKVDREPWRDSLRFRSRQYISLLYYYVAWMPSRIMYLSPLPSITFIVPAVYKTRDELYLNRSRA